MHAVWSRVLATGTWIVSVIAALALAAGFMSQIYEVTDPHLALTFNPFNTEASVNRIVSALNGAGDVDFDDLRANAVRLVSEARGDARGYSLLGAVLERQGDVTDAEALYRLTLEKSKSEIHALLRLANLRLARMDYVGALDCVDLILRRWSSYAPQVEPLILAAAQDAVAAPALTQKLNAMPPWRGSIIRSLARSPQGLVYARDLVATAPERVRAAPGWTGERDFMVSQLAAVKAYGEAHNLFLSTLSPTERELQGYIYDDSFTAVPNRTYFGWWVQRSGSTDILVPYGSSGLRIRFSDSPARPRMVTQTLSLPFGHYRLEAVLSASVLINPKGLYWRLTCAGGGELGRLMIAPGTYAQGNVEVEFHVPDSGCDIQTLSLDTEVLTDSWRDRYSGEVLFRRVALTRL